MTAQDLRVADLAMHAGCATLVVLNKWDAQAPDLDLDHERARVAEKLRQRPRVLTASAHTGRNVTRVLAEAITLADRRAARIPTPELNRFLGETVQARQPPAKQGHRLKLHLHGADRRAPAAFAIQVNSRTRVTRDYAYYVENQMRERYGLGGVPVVIDFVERGTSGASDRGAVADRPAQLVWRRGRDRSGRAAHAARARCAGRSTTRFPRRCASASASARCWSCRSDGATCSASSSG